MKNQSFFASTPKAMEAILAEELKQLGVMNVQPVVAGVRFTGTLETAYRVCLWSRTASRVLLPLKSFKVESKQDVYDAIKQINWFEHFKPDGSFAVSFNTKHSKAINNSHFGAQVVKDAIVDQMRAKFQKRPQIDTEHPDIRLNVYLNKTEAQLSLDLSGESLHKRGYRTGQVEAPIKENLAAAILLKSGWNNMAQAGKSLLDPMCGSGTLLLEAAMMAADVAPGLMKDYFGFIGWKQHDQECWEKLKSEATERKTQGMESMPIIVGYDQSRKTVATAIANVENAGFQNKIHIEKRDIAAAQPADSWPAGLLVCNPPYGERLGDEQSVSRLYTQFGEILKSRFKHWQAALIISNPEMGFRLGIRSKKPLTLYNGALECKLLLLDIEENRFFVPKAKSTEQRLEQIEHSSTLSEMTDENAEMFANRLRKNLKKLTKWAKKQAINCYRVYDADIPEYAVAIDLYYGEQLWVNVQEYDPPKSVAPHKANQRLGTVMAEIPKILDIDKSQVFLKIRRKQKSTTQYEKLANTGHFHAVEEQGCRLLVNFQDYLDTGLFLDHRPIRWLIQQQAKDKRFLNLFAYTGVASVHAAIGGAQSTTTVDMSNTYLDWAKQNFALNNLTGDHQFIRADCLEWLQQQSEDNKAGQYDLIFLDPPTFSNSKRMEGHFDIQRDYVQLIQHALSLLSKTGVLYFSTNFKRFKLDADLFPSAVFENISDKTVPEDFARNPKIHYCWKIQKP